ncbi:MAG: CO dehydrogenase/acetyl-CoA synthase complex subunit epsilon [Deltaproteobacteria bacterium]|nr:CO dehydrogenase/acetyl-CoA synthase complex subunit epsilon [Deltaproteobacteria bacterium]
MATVPYHRVNVLTGIKGAAILEKPEQFTKIISKAERPLLVLGPRLLEWSLDGRSVLEHALDIAKTANIPICATAHLKGKLTELEVTPDSVYDAVEIVNVLRDPDWKGVKGEGNHDLVIFFGIRSDLQNQCLSVLKHFAYKHLKTMTLDKYYFPNADFSLTNVTKDKSWKAFLEGLKSSLQTKA